MTNTVSNRFKTPNPEKLSRPRPGSGAQSGAEGVSAPEDQISIGNRVEEPDSSPLWTLGPNATVPIIDTGIDYSSPGIDPGGVADWASSQKLNGAGHGHSSGTHVSATIAASGNYEFDPNSRVLMTQPTTENRDEATPSSAETSPLWNPGPNATVPIIDTGIDYSSPGIDPGGSAEGASPQKLNEAGHGHSSGQL